MTLTAETMDNRRVGEDGIEPGRNGHTDAAAFCDATNPAAVLDLIAEVRRLRLIEASAVDYVEGLITNDVEMAGSATKSLTTLVLDAVYARKTNEGK
jgi:hypothetical protein